MKWWGVAVVLRKRRLVCKKEVSELCAVDLCAYNSWKLNTRSRN